MISSPGFTWTATTTCISTTELMLQGTSGSDNHDDYDNGNGNDGDDDDADQNDEEEEEKGGEIEDNPMLSCL